MSSLKCAIAFATLSAPAFAENHASGDPIAGEALFNRQCVACHMVKNAEGEVLAGRSAMTGPNLFDMSGRAIGSMEGFNYGEAIVAVNATGAVWDEAAFVAYVQDPTEYLRTTLDDRRARSKMSFKVRSADDAANIWAYLATFQAAQ